MPGSSDVQETIADAQRRSGDFEASIATTARAIELDPRNTRLLQLQATTYAAVHDAGKFHQHLDRVLEIEPDSFGAQFRRLAFGLWLGDDLAGLRAIVEAANRDTGSFWIRSRWLLGIFERDFDAVISFLDEMPDDVLGIDTRARFYATTYQLAGQLDLAEPYFEVAKEYLEQQLADQYFPEFRSRWLMNLAEITAGLGKFDEARRLAEESMAMKFPDEPAVTKQLLSAQPSASSYQREIMIALLN